MKRAEKMGSRENILDNIYRAQFAAAPLPALEQKCAAAGDNVVKFCALIESIGGKAIEIGNLDELREYVNTSYPSVKRIISTIRELPSYNAQFAHDPHSFEDVDLAILKGHFAVAENGAIWITDGLMGDRAIPFIVLHLALVVKKADIVPTLYEAYLKIDSLQYEFGIFIAGPSKTADIEQSLVLGAHGPKSMTVFLID